MNIDKMLDKRISKTINEYNRVNRLLFPDAELVWLSREQSNVLALDLIGAMLLALMAERESILMEQCSCELDAGTDDHERPAYKTKNFSR